MSSVYTLNNRWVNLILQLLINKRFRVRFLLDLSPVQFIG